MKYIVLKPFKYNMKDYVRSDEIDNEVINIPAHKIATRIKAGIIVEENKLTQVERAKIVKAKSVNKAVEKQEPVKEEPKEEVKEEPKEEPTLFTNTNVGGGKGKNKNKN